MNTIRHISILTVFAIMVSWNSFMLNAAEAEAKIDLSKVKITKETVALWKEHCSSCHGMDGRGKTKAGRKAKVKDLTDKKYQASFTDTAGFLNTKNGMKNKKGKEAMKPFGEKVRDEELMQLMKFLRVLPDKKKK
ncbi:MAG: c-type cytochrome [Verrucomicrobia bacterium]|jgi:cytochrome c553|nr:c-type cytochrome [Verrucomicrobiota bacterium]